MNLPLEIVDKILQYDWRIKYRKSEFVNVIHPRVLDSYGFILNSLLEKKINMYIDFEWLTTSFNGIVETDENYQYGKRFIDNKYVYTNKFYFEFEFDSLPRVGLSYDYYWTTSFFEICYYDFRNPNEWNNHRQIRTIIQ